MNRTLRARTSRLKLLSCYLWERLQRIRESFPLRVRKQYRIGEQLLAEARYPEAELALKHVLSANPRHFRAQARLGEAYRWQRKLLPAMDAYAKAYLMNPRRYASYKLMYAHMSTIQDVQQAGLLGEVSTKLRTCATTLSQAAQRLQRAVMKQQNTLNKFTNAQRQRLAGTSRPINRPSESPSPDGIFSSLEERERLRFLSRFNPSDPEAQSSDPRSSDQEEPLGEEEFGAEMDLPDLCEPSESSSVPPLFEDDLGEIDWDSELRKLK